MAGPGPGVPRFAVRFDERVGGGMAIALILLPVLLIGLVTVARTAFAGTVPSLHPGVAALAPADLTDAAADLLEGVTTTPGGTGVTFEVVQRSTLVARADGPRIEIPDPADPYKSLGLADTYDLAVYLERGMVTPDGFHAEIRQGALERDAAIEFGANPVEFAALVRDGRTYRSDGVGWYETDQPPGIGLDPATAALLPTLLRNADAATDVQVTDVAELIGAGSEERPSVARALAATADVADIPGIIGVDLAEATELTEPVRFAFDERGRLIGLVVVARNLHMTDFDLVVETVITFSYPEKAPALPVPEPRFDPDSITPSED